MDLQFNKDYTEALLSAASVLIALFAYYRARRADIRSEKAEAINQLLGEKETVGFAAIKLLRSGLPKAKTDRSLVLLAVLQACMFEGSDRARALLYRVIGDNLETHETEILHALNVVQETYSRMDSYGFTKNELDLKNGDTRLRALQKVIKAPCDGA